jgi:hypothetical protein
MANSVSVAVDPAFLAKLLEASLDPRQNKQGKSQRASRISMLLT